MNPATALEGLFDSLAGSLIRSNLAILIIILSLVAGIIEVLITPTEEGPTINDATAEEIVGYLGLVEVSDAVERIGVPPESARMKDGRGIAEDKQ